MNNFWKYIKAAAIVMGVSVMAYYGYKKSARCLPDSTDRSRKQEAAPHGAAFFLAISSS